MLDKLWSIICMIWCSLSGPYTHGNKLSRSAIWLDMWSECTLSICKEEKKEINVIVIDDDDKVADDNDDNDWRCK